MAHPLEHQYARIPLLTYSCSGRSDVVRSVIRPLFLRPRRPVASGLLTVPFFSVFLTLSSVAFRRTAPVRGYSPLPENESQLPGAPPRHRSAESLAPYTPSKIGPLTLPRVHVVARPAGQSAHVRHLLPQGRTAHCAVGVPAAAADLRRHRQPDRAGVPAPLPLAPRRSRPGPAAPATLPRPPSLLRAAPASELLGACAAPPTVAPAARDRDAPPGRARARRRAGADRREIAELTSEIRAPGTTTPTASIFTSLFRDPKPPSAPPRCSPRSATAATATRPRRAQRRRRPIPRRRRIRQIQSARASAGPATTASERDLHARRHQPPPQPLGQRHLHPRPARGCTHQHATRILGRAWCAVIWRMWHNHGAYDPAQHQRSSASSHSRVDTGESHGTSRSSGRARYFAGGGASWRTSTIAVPSTCISMITSR